MSGLDHATLQRFVRLLAERLDGDWVVLGGSALTLLGIEERVTLDIDVAPLGAAGQEETVALLRIAADLGLPVETVNQAAAFYLREIPDWRRDLVVVHRGPRGTVHVPGATLYVLTKLGRLSSSDLSDCLAMLRRARDAGETIDAGRLLDAVDAALAATPSDARAGRLHRLRDAVEVPGGE